MYVKGSLLFVLKECKKKDCLGPMGTSIQSPISYIIRIKGLHEFGETAMHLAM